MSVRIEADLRSVVVVARLCLFMQHQAQAFEQIGCCHEPVFAGAPHVVEGLELLAQRRPGGLERGGGRWLAFQRRFRLRLERRLVVDVEGRAELGGEVTIGGTIQNVVPAGQFELIRGRLDILGQRINLTEATVVLQGDFNPFISVRAETQRDDNTIAVIIEGPVSEPEVTFSSTPDRPQEEVLALLLFGRDLSEISGLQALRIANAINTLAGRSGTSIVDRLRQSTGLDDIDVQTTADGQTEVRLGRYINERAYTDVTVNSEGDTEVNLNLTVTPSITARGTVGTDGNTGVGVYYERDY